MRLLAALFFASSANAAFLDGNALLSKMNGDTPHKMQAIGYIQGVHDAMESVNVCAPANVTSGQIFDMVKNYLENVPANRHLSAEVIVGHILINAWPCKSQKNNSTQKSL